MLLEIIVDVTLTLLLVVGLSRSKTGFKQTDRLIKRVLQLTVETQLPPTLSCVYTCLSAWSSLPLDRLDVPPHTIEEDIMLTI